MKFAKVFEPEVIQAFYYADSIPRPYMDTKELATTIGESVEGEVREVISRMAVESGNYILCVIQEAAGILGSIACAATLVHAYMQKKGKKTYFKILALYGLYELGVYILPYLAQALGF